MRAMSLGELLHSGWVCLLCDLSGIAGVYGAVGAGVV